MLLQPTLHHHKASLSSTLSQSHSLQRKNPHFTLRQGLNDHKRPVKCSISQIHNYGTVDYERRPVIKWNAIYRRISLMENPELGSGAVLDKWEKEGKRLSKWELSRVIKELRKYRRFQQALEVYEWMNARPERFRVTPSDAAIQLDLIAKVRGISSGEEFFFRLPETLKNRKVFGALLNAYVRSKMKEKAESFFSQMRSIGYVSNSLTYNVMMTLYMNFKEYDKVDLLASEMIKDNTQLDICSYNIWLSSCGSQGSAEKLEQVFEQMKLDDSIVPNWTTFTTMATMYVKMGLLEKAEQCLRKAETRITGRDRIPYHYLLTLYGNVGNKEEVYRVWNIYKLVFPTIPNLGYHAIISSLVRMDDVEGAEKLYEEWLSIKSSFDPRLANLLMGWHVKEGNFNRVDSIFDQMLQVGGTPNVFTWEILAERHVKDRRTPDALSCYGKALVIEESKGWKPKPTGVSSFFALCEEESDLASKDVLVGLLRQSGRLEDKGYALLVGLSEDDANETGTTDENDGHNAESDGSEMLFSQSYHSL